MFSFAFKRPRLADWRGWAPTGVLLAALASLFALGGDRGYFYREGTLHDVGIHTLFTAETLGIAENLSPEHDFRLARRVWIDDGGGGFRYALYSRFPVGGYALVKLAIMPFGNDLAAKLAAARALSLLMVCGAALFAYLAVARIAGSRWVALAAALLAFSGLYVLYYADSVFKENVIEMFGLALAFHGMVVFVQEGRFRQLLVKVCLALLVGWRVYAMLMPFIALGLGGEALAHLRAALASDERAKLARTAIISLARSRYVALAAVSIAFGSALLAFNFANEYAAYRDELTLPELPSVRSMINRFGLGDVEDPEDPNLAWGGFLERQLYRAGAAAIPYGAARTVGYEVATPEPVDLPLVPTVLGAAATVAALALTAFARRYRILWATAALFGFCWAIPMRHHTFTPFHNHETVIYLWLALALFALALAGARRLLGERGGERLAIGVGAAAALVFATSVFHAGRLARDTDGAEMSKAALADFSAVMELAREKRVRALSHNRLWSDPVRYWDLWMKYYLAGSYPQAARDCSDTSGADFVVAPYRDDSMNLLTPENRTAFLYGAPDPLETCRAQRRRLESSQPAARAAFDVYLQDGALSYLKAPCEPSDYDAPFFGYLYPVDLDDLPSKHRRGGFHPGREAATFAKFGAAFDGACLMTLHLPDYPIAAVRTGQRTPGGETIWEALITPPPSAEALALYEKTFQAIAASGEPAARAGFDLYLDPDEDTLFYLKEPCDENDVRGRFFLSVRPVDVRDLPAARRDAGHESLNFTFAPPDGVVFGGKCMARRILPDYPTTAIETGQWIPGGGRLWEAEIVVGD